VAYPSERSTRELSHREIGECGESHHYHQPLCQYRVAETFAATPPCTGIHFKQYFVFVSTIEPRKNLDRLLNAYLLYRDDLGEAALPLLICGHPGWKSGSIHQRLKELTSLGDVRHLGYLPQQSLPTLIAGARALLYLTLYEGLGLPVLEAMQAGTVVMTTRDTAAAEVADDAAYCVHAESEDEITEGIRTLYHHLEKVAPLVRLGLERAKYFS